MFFKSKTYTQFNAELETAMNEFYRSGERPSSLKIGGWRYQLAQYANLPQHFVGKFNKWLAILS